MRGLRKIHAYMLCEEKTPFIYLEMLFRPVADFLAQLDAAWIFVELIVRMVGTWENTSRKETRRCFESDMVSSW